MRVRLLMLALVAALFLSALGVSLADDAIELPRWALSGGASDSAAGSDSAVRATLGEPVVGQVTGGGGEVSLGQGFWAGGPLVGGYDIFLPLITR